MAYKYNPLLKSGLQEVTASDAASTTYDNAVSGLAATDVQDAIDEVANQVYGTATVQTFLQCNVVSIATVTVVVNSLRGYFITIDKQLTIKDLRVRMSTGAAGAAIYGIYTVNTVGYPIDLIYTTTAFNNALTTQQSYSSDLIILKGTYFVAYNSNSAPIAHAYSSGFLYNTAGGIQATISSSAANAGLGIAYVYTGTLPVVFPLGAVGLGNVNHPIITFLIS